MITITRKMDIEHKKAVRCILLENILGILVMNAIERGAVEKNCI